MAHRFKSKVWIIGIFILLLMVSIVSASIGYKTVYSAFTGKLDYVWNGLTDFTGYNITADNFFGKFNWYINSDSTNWLYFNTTYLGFNQTTSNATYVNVDGDTMTGDLNIQNSNIKLTNSNITGTSGSSGTHIYIDTNRDFIIVLK